MMIDPAMLKNSTLTKHY